MADKEVRMIHRIDELDMTIRWVVSVDDARVDFLDLDGKAVTAPDRIQAAVDHLRDLKTIGLDLERPGDST
jgi:hypothetical protein